MTKYKNNKVYAVPNCYTRCEKNNQIAFHQFPKDKLLQKQWIHVTRFISITKNSYACSMHFDDSDYKSKYLLNILPK